MRIGCGHAVGNVVHLPACRFYVKHGCVLAVINRFGYDEFPDEVELVWYKSLKGGEQDFRAYRNKPSGRSPRQE